jgi:glucose/arabinose dehydrogenase
MSIRFACAVVLALLTVRPAMAQLPAGFEEVVVVSGLAAPTAMAFAPDGRLFVCEMGGRVRVYKQGQLLSTPFVQLSVTANSERGLLGIAFDPNFGSNRFVYLYYTTSSGSRNPPPSPKNRVSRFTANGDVAVAGSETILVDNIPSDAGNHNAGCLRFGLDGKLYVATGDGGANANNSQNLGNLAGKILRINPDGSIPSDNPFYGQAGRRWEIYCYGLRNPFRFHFRPGTNTMFIADVGQNTWEEVNVGQAGANYGWPTYEGPTNVAGYIGPIYAYSHNGSGASITGGCFITSTNYPAEYRGSYFFGDYVRGFIRRLTINANNTLNQALSFGPAAAPVDFAQGLDGDLHYVSISTGSVRKIRYVGALNRVPVAKSSASPLSGPLPLTVSFSSAGSGDPDGDPLTFLWNFGDNTTSTLPNPSHTYTVAGTYTVTLQVRDSRGGATNATPLQIRAGNDAPVVTITSPTDERLYNAGDVIAFSGTATDREDGTLAPSRMQWVVTFFHADHTHPFQTFTGVASGSFTIPRTGESSADTWYEICLTATDSNGARTTACVQIRPRKVSLTFQSSPGWMELTFNGQRFQTPFTIQSVVGFDHQVGAPDQVWFDGQIYTWRFWSDGGARDHTIRAPATNTTYTATFGPKR